VPLFDVGVPVPGVADGAEGGAGCRPSMPHAAVREIAARRPSGAGYTRMAMNLGPF